MRRFFLESSNPSIFNAAADLAGLRYHPAIMALDADEPTQLVTIRKFRDLPEALLAKGGLESAGIPCSLADDNMVRLDWFISNLIGGVKLQVRSEDAAAATEILDQPIPEEFEVEGSGEYQQPRCPECQSLEVSFEELDKPVAFVSAFIGFPLPVHRRNWKCHDCGREWEDPGHTPQSGA